MHENPGCASGGYTVPVPMVSKDGKTSRRWATPRTNLEGFDVTAIQEYGDALIHWIAEAKWDMKSADAHKAFDRWHVAEVMTPLQGGMKCQHEG